MLVVAGLTLKNLQPRVWEPASPHYLPDLRAVMLSYAEFHQRQRARRAAMEQGLRRYLGIGDGIAVYLDNGAFQLLRRGGEVPRQEYEAFVRDARPDWCAIPQEYIPTPAMSDAEQLECLRRTMEVNRAYRHNGFVPVVHASRHLDAYLDQLLQDEQLSRKPHVGLGGLVPNLLRAPLAAPYAQVLRNVRRTRTTLSRHRLHVFGIGGTATLHLAVLLGIDSVDSSGWRNRAARGIVQLSGRGDRMVAELGSWRGRRPDDGELLLLAACPCPACRRSGLPGLRSSGVHGFANRATHNLWTLLEEARSVSAHLADQTYAEWFEGHLHNSIYVPLVRRTLLDLQHPDSSVHPQRQASATEPSSCRGVRSSFA